MIFAHSSPPLYSYLVSLFRYGYYSSNNSKIQAGDACMEKFSPKKSEQVVTTIRIPKDILDLIDQKSAAVDISRNEFINQCVLYALQNMEDNN